MKKILLLLSAFLTLTLNAQIYSGVVDSQGGGVAYCNEYQTVYNAQTNKPDAATAAADNTMVAALVSGGYWAKFAVFYCPSDYSNIAGEALINWKNPGTYNLTNVSATAWTQFQGFTGDATADYLSTGFNPGTDSALFKLNDASYAIYLRVDQNVATVAVGSTSGSDQITLFPRNSGSGSARLNSSAASGPTIANTLGLFFIVRPNPSQIIFYQNSTAKATTTVSSTNIPNDVVEILARGGATFSSNQFAIMFMGLSFSSGDVTAITNIIETRMDVIGTGVVAYLYFIDSIHNRLIKIAA